MLFAARHTGTTLRDIESATCVDRSTLDDRVGGQGGRYHRATARDLDHSEVALFGPLHDPATDGPVAVTEFLVRCAMG